MRQSRRDRRWARERGALFAGADALVISYTKSGRTWLRVMLSHLCHRLYQIDAQELIAGDNFKRRNPKAPAIHFTRDMVFPPSDMGPTQHHITNAQSAIFLLRDPRDVAVSFYHHITKRAGPQERRRKGIEFDATTLDIDSFVLDQALGVRRVIAKLNEWAAGMDDISRHRLLHYEQLRADPCSELEATAQYLGLPADRSDIEAAVEFSQFDNMKEKEREGYFRSNRLGATAADDPDSSKVRRGIVGGYRDALLPATVEQIDQWVATELSPRMGYGVTH
ncbi:MAG: sulfotransferase domain-containing protein [Pseudomonadota bacterium]